MDGWVGNADIIVYETDKPSKIPASVRQGTYQLISSSIYGIAFEADGELCTIVNDGRNNPQETVFRTMGDDDGTPYGKVVSYPIFKMGDILTNNRRVSEKITSAIAAIRNRELRSCRHQTENSYQDSIALTKNLERVYDLIETQYTDLARSIRTLEGYQDVYDTMDKSDDSVREKSRAVAINLKKDHEMIINLIKVCSDITEYRDQIRELNEKISNIAKYIEKSSEDINKIYTE